MVQTQRKYNMKRRPFVILEILVFLLAIAVLKSCPGRIKYLLGERIVKLNVKNSHGAYTLIP